MRTETLAAGLVIHAIGYRGSGIVGLPFEPNRAVIPHRQGRVLDHVAGEIMPGTCVAGWITRGPTGTIGSNKFCARETVHALIDDFRHDRFPPTGRPCEAFADFVRSRQPDLVTYRGWQAIDRLERQRAEGHAPRHKLTSIAEMVSVARA